MFLQKYDEAKVNGVRTHRVSDVFCGEQAGSLRHDFKRWVNEGVISIDLRTWLTAYQLCCLDDGMQESPHGIITKIAMSRPNSTPKCWAALYRYKQNMDLKRSLDMIHPGRFNSLFQYWGLIFSKRPTFGPSRLVHPRNLGQKKFFERVYRMNDFAFSSMGTMKKDQEQFHRDTTDHTLAVTLTGKMTREYLRMVLLPKDIVSFVPYVPQVDLLTGEITFVVEEVSVLEPPELYSIISSDQSRLKTIVTQSALGDYNASAPFMAP